MGDVEIDTIDVKGMSEQELEDFIKKNALALKVSEIRKISELIGRNPTLTEIHIFNIEWSEHCSYKSSRKWLKLLPTENSKVIQGPQEDAGIIEFTVHGGERYGIVIAHESHNHPSQVVPYEGAATGVGGIIRDVLCMGAHIFATADPLRFGSPAGKKKNYVKYVANAVIDGIAGYGNPVGIPNIGGDIYFSESFDDNCLVNVVSLGILKEKDIIHSAAPKNAEGYDIVIVGKATDNSGFGGAAFASLVLDEDEEEYNKGAVQVPDPFLKNILIRATEAVFKEARKKGIELGFKDMGAGGIMCSSSELCESGGYGAELDITQVHVSMNDLPPYITACAETQERFTWICPPKFTERLLEIYNNDFELPNIAEGAQATIVGKVTKNKDYILKHKGKVICNAPIEAVTSGIKYDRDFCKKEAESKEMKVLEPDNYNEAVLNILKHPNIASKEKVYKHYDTEVQGLTIIRSGEADAGLMAPLPGCKAAVALSVDCNPRYCRIDPYHGAINAVAESMRNVAAVGATPYGMTDCLCYGNPEKPESFNDFVEGVKGISDAAKNIYLKGTKEPVAFVSGNVSFYNESVTGTAIDPQPIIACLGVIDNYENAINMKIKKKDSVLFMVGERKDELGGSVYYEINDQLGKNIPKIDFEKERGMIYGIIDCIEQGLLLSCHDISDGGMITAVAEMILGGDGSGKLGCQIDLSFTNLRPDKTLFSESSGFIFEIEEKNIDAVKEIFKKYNIEPIKIGKTIINDNLIIKNENKKIIDMKIYKMSDAWLSGFREAMR